MKSWLKIEIFVNNRNNWNCRKSKYLSKRESFVQNWNFDKTLKFWLKIFAKNFKNENFREKVQKIKIFAKKAKKWNFLSKFEIFLRNYTVIWKCCNKIKNIQYLEILYLILSKLYVQVRKSMYHEITKSAKKYTTGKYKKFFHLSGLGAIDEVRMIPKIWQILLYDILIE